MIRCCMYKIETRITRLALSMSFVVPSIFSLVLQLILGISLGCEPTTHAPCFPHTSSNKNSSPLQMKRRSCWLVTRPPFAQFLPGTSKMICSTSYLLPIIGSENSITQSTGMFDPFSRDNRYLLANPGIIGMEYLCTNAI